MRHRMTAPPAVQEQILQPGGRRYTIAIPQGYPGARPAPLVMALHFSGPVTPFYGKLILTGLVELALRELGAIILAPDCNAVDWTHPQSEAGILALLDYVQESYHVDPRKTLITGYSMGGKGTWYLAARNQEQFAAALIMAGWPPSDAVTVQWKIPLYIIHGRQDKVMPLEPTETVARQLKVKGVSVELIVLDNVTHYETNRFVAPLRAAVPWIERAWTSNHSGS